MFNRRFILLVAFASVVLVAGAMFVGKSQQRPQSVRLQFVGTRTCAGCHQRAYELWTRSDHRHAMEVADARSVLGDFRNATFDYGGVTSRFFTRDGKYFVETDNARGALETFQISYTFGRYPLQQYLVKFPDGRLQPLSISWDSRPAGQGGQRWYHLYADENITHTDLLHWTGAFQNWNARCATCHSTNVVKNYSVERDTYDTRWHEINVGCEACHGPGSQHVDWANGARSRSNKGLATHVRKVWEPVSGKLPIPAGQPVEMNGQVQVCSGCHSRRAELQQQDLTKSYFDNYSLSPLLEGRYFADGQMREEVYDTGSFLQSRMYANHVSCTNCHDPHSGQLRKTGNDLCLQCHEPRRFQISQHLLHEPASAGAQCVRCHMPQQTYMGVDVRHDHSFRVPDPIASVRLGVPNACTQCHTDRTDDWAAELIAQRTGRREVRYPHAALIAAARKNVASVAPGLLAYARDTSRPAILRSIVLMESARFPSPSQRDVIAASLGSNEPLVRLGGVYALGGLDVDERRALLQPLFNDPVKAVRMAVAREMIDASPPPKALLDEYEASLLYNADMPESQNELGLLHAARGDFDEALKALLHARKLAPRYLPAMLNLADVYRAMDRDDLGEAVLGEAAAANPESADVHHLLGLLLVRTGRTSQSVARFEQASRLAPDNARYALVYGLALVETGKRTEGVRVLRAAGERFPENREIAEALESYRQR